MAGRFPGIDDTLSYGIFLCTGIVLWGYFAEVVSRCQQVFLEYGNLLKRMSFPRTSLPVIVLLTASFNFALIFTLFMLLLLVIGRFPGGALWAFVPLVLVQQGLAVGLGVLAGTLHVFFRDVGQALAVLLHLWFWGTPIVYHLGIVPEGARRLIRFNPLTRLFESYQGIMLENRLPDWAALWPVALVAAAALTLALFAFRKLAWEMVDEL
jgi:lipopolysaccharide transport system permease protein